MIIFDGLNVSVVVDVELGVNVAGGMIFGNFVGVIVWAGEGLGVIVSKWVSDARVTVEVIKGDTFKVAGIKVLVIDVHEDSKASKTTIVMIANWYLTKWFM